MPWRKRIPCIEQDGEWELERLLLKWGKSSHPLLWARINPDQNWIDDDIFQLEMVFPGIGFQTFSGWTYPWTNQGFGWGKGQIFSWICSRSISSSSSYLVLRLFYMLACIGRFQKIVFQANVSLARSLLTLLSLKSIWSLSLLPMFSLAFLYQLNLTHQLLFIY